MDEHQPVELAELLSVDGVVAHGEIILGVPVKLCHPDGQPELLPQCVHMLLDPASWGGNGEQYNWMTKRYFTLPHPPVQSPYETVVLGVGMVI